MLDNFKKIAEYRPGLVGPDYESYIGRKKSEIRPIVYLFVIEDTIVYVGETRRGYGRPLSYHKNTVMERQRTGISQAINSGKIVEVFAIEVPNFSVEFNGETFSSYVAQDYEKFLITKLKPEWNGRS